MTAFAYRKVVTTKSALAIVARHATEGAWRSMMVERLRRAHTPSARLDPVTLVTIQPLGSIVFRVTETNTKRGRRLRGASVTFHPMASATGGNIATIRLRTLRVTPEAVRMRIEACRYRERHSATQGPVTTVATQAAEVLVPCVIETHSKT